MVKLEGSHTGEPVLWGAVMAGDGVTILGQGLAETLIELDIPNAGATVLTFYGPLDDAGSTLIMHQDWQSWRDMTLAWRDAERQPDIGTP